MVEGPEDKEAARKSRLAKRRLRERAAAMTRAKEHDIWEVEGKCDISVHDGQRSPEGDYSQGLLKILRHESSSGS